eukprot:15759670-Heterocapsa_arctica.AAC.1
MPAVLTHDACQFRSPKVLPHEARCAQLDDQRTQAHGPHHGCQTDGAGLPTAWQSSRGARVAADTRGPCEHCGAP